MSGKTFRPTIARTQNSMKIFTSTKTNATIRDLEEEEGELEEKEGIVVSIKRDLINGAGWTVKDAEGNTYICSCASSMYEVPETVERGGILYPTDDVEVVFTVNPVLRINTIKEIKSLGEETEKIDISQWTHGDLATTVIAKPKSAVSISDGFIELNYDNDNSVLADTDAIKTEGKETQINTDKLTINSEEVQIGGISINDMIDTRSLSLNTYNTYSLQSPSEYDITIDAINNMTQLSINANNVSGSGVIGHIKNQQDVPIKEQRQVLVTDGNCVDVVVINEDGIVSIQSNNCTEERTITSMNNWISPQAVYRNYIKVTVKDICNYCDEGNNTLMEYINYCPHCNKWNYLINTYTYIKCNACDTHYCQNCGKSLSNPSERLKKYRNNYIYGYGTTCKQCRTELKPNTNKEYVNYCPDCEQWGFLYNTQRFEMQDIEHQKTVNVLKCGSCNAEYCCTCGINQDKYGLEFSNTPAKYDNYTKALRKLKYIKDN